MRSIYDDFKLSDDRAKEIVEKIKATKIQVPIVSEYQDHIGIIAYLKKFTMDKEFEELEEIVRDLINEHIKMRLSMEASNTLGQPANPMAPPGMPGLPPM
jgi:hypothetical protein